MNKLPVYVSESDFETHVLPNLTHKTGHNRQKVSYHGELPLCVQRHFVRVEIGLLVENPQA